MASFKLKNGKEYSGKAVPSGVVELYLFFEGGELKEVYPDVANEKNVAQIVAYDDKGTETIYNGYVKLIAIKQESENLVSVELMKI